MKKHNRLKIILAAVIVFLVAINVFKYLRSVKTEMVQHGEMEKSFSFDAVVIRGETLITADKKGVLESMVSEGELVRKDKNVASIYEDAVDESAKKKLLSINERINEIKNIDTSSADVYHAETGIDSKILEIIDASEEHDAAEISDLKNELGLLNDKRNAYSGGEERVAQMLAELADEKEKYEKSLSKSSQDLFSPASGIYSTKIDGYEQMLTVASADALTPEDLDSVRDAKVTEETIAKSGAVCKIIDNLEWYVAVTVTENELSSLKLGDTVYIRNHDSSEDAEASVKYISAPQNGRYVLVASSNVACDWAMNDRFVKIDLIRNKYSGLKVRLSAIRVKDDVTGVYTVVGGMAEFKPVNIIYKSGGYAIVEEDNASAGGLLLYDEVIIDSKRTVKDGMKVN